jgi:hypothetical protein
MRLEGAEVTLAGFLDAEYLGRLFGFRSSAHWLDSRKRLVIWERRTSPPSDATATLYRLR